VVFRLENLLPPPLEDTDTSSSQVWRKSIQLDTARIIRLIAPSGKGKSTLIHILYGRRKDYSGKVLLEGDDIIRFDAGKWASLRQRHLSIVFQELMLFPELTGLENIQLKNHLTKYYEEPRIRDMAERLNGGHLMKKKCGIMSFGERQRIAILRALVQPFNWLLLDEPFSHLDEAHAHMGSKLIADECQRRQAGILIAALGDDDFFPYNQTLLL